MAYQVLPATQEEREKQGKGFKVVEEGFSGLTLCFCDTEAEALDEVSKWETRDVLTEDIEDFETDMLEKYEGRLPEREIRQMLKEYFSPEL